MERVHTRNSLLSKEPSPENPAKKNTENLLPPFLPTKTKLKSMRPYNPREKGSWKNILASTYAHLVKEVCASCGDNLKYDLKRYERQGNTCNPCDQRATRNMRVRKISEKELDAIFRNGRIEYG